MFIETEEGKLQNLYLLQDVRVVENDKNPEKYSIGYVQMNGEIYKEGEYTTLSEAEEKKTAIIQKLLQV